LRSLKKLKNKLIFVEKKIIKLSNISSNKSLVSIHNENLIKKNTLQDTTGSKNNYEKNGVVLVNNKESQSIINNINGIYDVLMKNQDMTKQALEKIISKIQEDFKNSQFDFYGTIVDMNFIKKNAKEIEENKEIWEEILDGDFSNYEKITFINYSVALTLSKFQGKDLYLNKLKFIDKDSAHALSQFQGSTLSLMSLNCIDKDSGYALNQFKGFSLRLPVNIQYFLSMNCKKYREIIKNQR
jgi:hypothetical protein